MQQTFGSCGLFSPLPFLHAGLPRLYTELANAICHTIPSTFTIKLGDDAVKWNISHRLINLRLFRLMSNLQTMFGHIKTHASCYYSDSISKMSFSLWSFVLFGVNLWFAAPLLISVGSSCYHVICLSDWRPGSPSLCRSVVDLVKSYPHPVCHQAKLGSSMLYRMGVRRVPKNLER